MQKAPVTNHSTAKRRKITKEWELCYLKGDMLKLMCVTRNTHCGEPRHPKKNRIKKPRLRASSLGSETLESSKSFVPAGSCPKGGRVHSPPRCSSLPL
jgi:hypothetical protein